MLRAYAVRDRPAARRAGVVAVALLALLPPAPFPGCSGGQHGPSDAELAAKIREKLQARQVVILERRLEFQTHRSDPPPPPGDDGTEYEVRARITKADGSLWEPTLRIFASSRTGEVSIVAVTSTNGAPPRRQ